MGKVEYLGVNAPKGIKQKPTMVNGEERLSIYGTVNEMESLAIRLEIALRNVGAANQNGCD